LVSLIVYAELASHTEIQKQAELLSGFGLFPLDKRIQHQHIVLLPANSETAIPVSPLMTMFQKNSQ
jgi:hypothetical protein